jgi:hypothetical protein
MEGWSEWVGGWGWRGWTKGRWMRGGGVGWREGGGGVWRDGNVDGRGVGVEGGEDRGG